MRYADSVTYKPGNGFAIIAKYNSENVLTGISFNKGEISAKLSDGEKIKLFNWNSLSGMKPNRGAVEFTVKYKEGEDKKI